MTAAIQERYRLQNDREVHLNDVQCVRGVRFLLRKLQTKIYVKGKSIGNNIEIMKYEKLSFNISDGNFVVADVFDKFFQIKI